MQEQGRALRALARSILGSVEGADDVVQSAYAAALHRPPHGGTTPGWLATVARNLARRMVRDRDRQRRHETLAARSGSHPATDDVVADAEMHRDLANAVLALAEPYRTVVVMRYWHDLPPRTISGQLGVPLATVKTRLQRGLSLLRARLDGCYGDRRAWLIALVPIARPQSLATLSSGTAASITLVAFAMNVKHILAAASAILLFSSLGYWVLTEPKNHAAPAPTNDGPTMSTADAHGGRPDTGPAASAAEEPRSSRAATTRGEVPESRPPCEVTGVAVSAVTLSPIAGATVRLTNEPSLERYPNPKTISDRRGRFLIESPWWGDSDWVAYRLALVSAPGLATREVRLDADVQERVTNGTLDLGTIRLVRGVAVTGRVFESDGQPLQGTARLLLWDPSYQGSFVSMYHGRTVGFTSEGGAFALAERLTPPAGGELELAAITSTGIGRVRLGIAPGQEQLDPLKIRLQPNGGLAVRVVDEAGAALAGATVYATPHFLPFGLAPMWSLRWASPPPEFPELTALFRRQTDVDGRADLPRLPMSPELRSGDANHRQGPSDNYIVIAQLDGYVQNETAAKPVLGRLQEVVITLHAKREVRIRGRVLTRNGSPVSGITVRGNGDPVSAVSDEHGHYAMEPSAYGEPAFLIAEGADYPWVASQVEIPEDGDTVEHDIVVDPRAPVNGRVVDQHGVPIAGARCSLGLEGGSHFRSTPEATGHDGVFAFPDATAIHDDLWIDPPEPRTAWEPAASRKISRRQGEVIVLRRLEGDLIDLHVTVVDGDTGRPLPPSEVELQPLLGDGIDSAQIRPLPEIAFGQITAKNVQSGRYRLIVRATDGRRGVRVLEIGDEPVAEFRMDLWQPATVICALDTSKLTNAERASIRSIAVSLLQEHEQSHAVDERGGSLRLTPNTGVFHLGTTERVRLARVTPNSPVCLRILGHGLFAETWFTARPGSETHVTLRPERAGTLAFRLPASLSEGTIQVDVADADGEWRVVRHARTMPAALRGTMKSARAPGTARWRLRFWPGGENEAAEHSGESEVVAGATTEIPWPGN